MLKPLAAILLLMAAAGAGYWYWNQNGPSGAELRTVSVERGDVVAAIKATGTVEPEEVINVGAQVAGRIVSFGRDPRDPTKAIDYSSPVEEGTVLAIIDDSVYRTQVDSAQAIVKQAEGALRGAESQVALAHANIDRADADVLQAQARAVQAKRAWDRARKLHEEQGAISLTDYEAAEALHETAEAAVAVAKAAVGQAKASLGSAAAEIIKNQGLVADANASLRRAEINLGYCTIRSPVKGVIVDRRVNVGQTVVSSLNSPSLFLIATDLRRVQVWASVNEADIGSIHAGQAVKFTVDAAPGKTFFGVVAPDSPRLNASMTQNVVTYTVVVNVDNSDGRLLSFSKLPIASQSDSAMAANTRGRLLPYLTANLEFEVSRQTGVLLVQNTAFRWQPEPNQVAPDARAAFEKSQRSQSDRPSSRSAAGKDRPAQRTLWLADRSYVRPVSVRAGLTDGLNTEVSGGTLKEGDEVVVGERRQDRAVGRANPFTPQRFGGGQRQQQQ